MRDGRIHDRSVMFSRAVWKFWGGIENTRPEDVEIWKTQGQAALGMMDQHLEKHDFFGDDLTIADIALYAYTHTASETGYDLDRAPHVVRWLDRVKSRPGHVLIKGGPGSVD